MLQLSGNLDEWGTLVGFHVYEEQKSSVLQRMSKLKLE